MLKGYNEEEIATDFPSIRRKYQGGRFGRSKINYGSVLNTHKKEITSNTEVKPIIKEEKIIIKEEAKVNRGIVAASPNETSSKITRTVINTIAIKTIGNSIVLSFNKKPIIIVNIPNIASNKKFCSVLQAVLIPAKA